MNREVFLRKITSRKFILALGAFVTSAVVMLGGSSEEATKIVALIANALTVVGYALVEGYLDSAGGEDGSAD